MTFAVLTENSTLLQNFYSADLLSSLQERGEILQCGRLLLVDEVSLAVSGYTLAVRGDCIRRRPVGLTW
jgi:hypothetical protein